MLEVLFSFLGEVGLFWVLEYSFLAVYDSFDGSIGFGDVE